MPEPRVLLVEDNRPLARAYVELLREVVGQIEHVATGQAALERLRRDPAEVVLLDLGLPDIEGLEVLRRIRAEEIPCSVVVVTADGSISVAVEAMRHGAEDFLVKPFPAERLRVTVRNAARQQSLARLVETYREALDRDGLDRLIGASPAMQAVYRMIESAAPSRASVFITGESGTGKELCAEAIHRLSPRASGPFIALNCAAIPRELIESEIFGHVKGAFTGAVADRAGAATRAEGGTLFLDEICEMDLDLQSKLLRFLQTGSFQRVGGNRLESADIRFLCATNRDPQTEVAEGRFREDLYYRLYVIPIDMPPLRERQDDVLILARSFLKEFAEEEGKPFGGFAPEVSARFMEHPWPGNVRELRNVVQRLVVLNEGPLITEDLLPATAGEVSARAAAVLRASAKTAVSPPPSVSAGDVGSIKPLRLVEREAIERAIELCEGNVPRAAAYLEVSPSTLYRKRSAWLTDED